MHQQPSSPISHSVLAIHSKFFLHCPRQPLRSPHIHFQSLVATEYCVVGPSFPKESIHRTLGAFLALLIAFLGIGAYLARLLPFWEESRLHQPASFPFRMKPNPEGLSHASAFCPSSSLGLSSTSNCPWLVLFASIWPQNTLQVVHSTFVTVHSLFFAVHRFQSLPAAFWCSWFTSGRYYTHLQVPYKP